MDNKNFAGCNCNVQNPTIVGTRGTTTNFSSYYPSGILSSGCYVFQGTVQMDINVLISSCTLEMEAGSEIRILSSKRLTITDNLIYACDTLWKGITVNSGARLWGSGNDIYDAQYAIKAAGTANVTLYNNEFYHNYVAFYIPPTGTQTSVHTVRLIFQNNIIDNPSILGGGTGLLRRPNYSGISPNPNGRAFAGFDVHNANLVIGSKSLASPYYRNYISNVMVGVKGFFCNLECHRLIINNMLNHGAGNTNYTEPEGIGILVRDCRLQATRDTITNALGGISGFRSWLSDISRNEIAYVRAGVHDFASMNSPEIGQNEIHHVSNIGIEVEFPLSLIAPLISYNIISTDGTTPTPTGSFMIGILFQTLGARSLGSVISWNELYLHSKSNGIDIRDCVNIGVGYNIVTYNDDSETTYSGVGIIHNDSRDGFVIENDVIASSGFNKIVGFHSINTGNTRFCCNYTSGTDYGFNFVGPCRRTNGFGHNEIRGLSAGLRLAISSIIGNQVNKGNLWNGSFPTANYYKGAAVNTGNQTEIRSSRFYVEDCDDPLWPPSIYPSQNCDESATNWFRFYEATSVECNEDNICDAEFLDPDRELVFADIDEGDEYLARGQMASGDYGFSLDYEGRRQLLERLRLDAGAHNQNSYVDSFYSASTGSSYAALMEIAFDIDTLLSYPGSDLEILDELKEGFRAASDSIRVLDSLISIAGNSTDSTNAINLREAQLVETDTMLMDLLELLDDHLNTIIADKEDLRDSNDTVDAINIIDSNEVIVNDMYLTMLGETDFSFNSTQAAEILDVAEQCPRLGGVIVYQARALYKLYASQTYDDYDCLDTSMVIRQKTDRSSNLHFIVKTNPAQQQIIVHLKADEYSSHKVIELCNIHGQVISRHPVNHDINHQIIDVPNMPNGMYLLNLKNGKQTLASQPVIISN
ncbi:MAG: T9SS type A sorting domain-containing protein [Saprospiraceae bacterium]|nr:T9SS type A sorting domain-containing protein [Saprospiraceae bacterium]